MADLAARLYAMRVFLRPGMELMRLCPRDGLLVVLLPLVHALLLGSGAELSLSSTAAVVLVALLWWGGVWSQFALLFDETQTTQRRSLSHHTLRLMSAACSLAAMGIALLVSLKMAALLLLPMVAGFLYPWLLRRTYLADGVLGVGVVALVLLIDAAHGVWPAKTALLLATALLPWVVAWRVVLRWPHYVDETALGVRSLASMFGPASPALVAGLQGFSMIGWWLLGQQAQLHHAFAIGWGVALLLVVALYLVMVRNVAAGNRRALIIHLLGAVVMAVSLLVAQLLD